MSSIEIHKNSITHISTDVIVNAANSSLAEGGGVCGAIFSAAGSSKLARECAMYGHCKTGRAVITSACDMKNAKYIVHAVGPIYSGGTNGEPEQLYSCYKESLKLAMDNYCRSIGFPLISSGIFGYPHDEAWKIALSACKDFINENPGYHLFFIVLSQDLMTCDCCHQRGDTLLTVDQHFLSDCVSAVFEFYIWILPNNQVAGRIPIEEGVNQITHLTALPHEGALYFRYCNVASFNIAQYGAYRILGYGVLRLPL